MLLRFLPPNASVVCLVLCFVCCAQKALFGQALETPDVIADADAPNQEPEEPFGGPAFPLQPRMYGPSATENRFYPTWLAEKRRKPQEQSGRYRLDPGFIAMGLGKRNNKNRPKYDPGWKFIGLGKRNSQDLDNPYLGVLALSNLGNFFTELKKEVQAENLHADGQNEEISNPGINSKVSRIHTRSRNPSGSTKTGTKQIYDPGWMMSGLGK